MAANPNQKWLNYYIKKLYRYLQLMMTINHLAHIIKMFNNYHGNQHKRICFDCDFGLLTRRNKISQIDKVVFANRKGLSLSN